MNPAEIIERVAEDGIKLAVRSSGRLSVKGSRSAIDVWLDVLRENKTAILLQLQAEADPWPAEEWRAFYDERAGIAEFEGGLSRKDAEALAYSCCEAEWLNRHPVRSSQGQCLGCGGGDHPHDALVPFGTETAGHAWLHQRCWEAWFARRRAEAAAALATMRIDRRSGLQ